MLWSLVWPRVPGHPPIQLQDGANLAAPSSSHPVSNESIASS